jgi:hypothetical protein
MPRGPLVSGAAVEDQPGHNLALESISATITQELESDLRRTRAHSPFQRLCETGGISDLSDAIGVAKYSQNPWLRSVAITYCKEWSSKCGLHEMLQKEHRECLSSTK